MWICLNVFVHNTLINTTKTLIGYISCTCQRFWWHVWQTSLLTLVFFSSTPHLFFQIRSFPLPSKKRLSLSLSHLLFIYTSLVLSRRRCKSLDFPITPKNKQLFVSTQFRWLRVAIWFSHSMPWKSRNQIQNWGKFILSRGKLLLFFGWICMFCFHEKFRKKIDFIKNMSLRSMSGKLNNSVYSPCFVSLFCFICF